MSDIKKVNVNKKLYDIKDPRSVCTFDGYPSYTTLDKFVEATNSTTEQTRRGYSFAFRDTGGWGPGQTVNMWYRCLIVRYQNRIGSDYDIGGAVLLADDNGGLYFGWIQGQGAYTAKWITLIQRNFGLAAGGIKTPVDSRMHMMNGHFLADPAGFTALTSHAAGDTNTLYRMQLQSTGVLDLYVSEDGSTWTRKGSYVRSDQVSSWTSKAITLTSGYFNTDSYVACRYNQHVRLSTAVIHLYISTIPANGTVIATGLPKALVTTYAGIVQTGVGQDAARLYVNASGNLIVAGTIGSTGWHSGSVTYPYSSL